MKVCIDPGHGMANRTPGVFDPGAVHGTTFEADIALAVGFFLRDECARRGWQFVMTRNDSSTPSPLGRRVGIAKAGGADCLVSIHCNAHDKITANGTETLYSHAERLAAAVQRRLVAELGTRDRGVKRGDGLAVLRYDRPAILVELGFISNPADRALLVSGEWQKKAAVAIADGIEEAVTT